MQKPSKEQAQTKKGKTLKEKIQRHLEDKNDVITEEDLKEVVVGVEAVDLENPVEPNIQETDVIPNSQITPWDVTEDEK